MRFKKGQLISEDAFLTKNSIVYLVTNCDEKYVYLTNLSELYSGRFELRGVDNVACFNEHGTIQDLIKNGLK